MPLFKAFSEEAKRDREYAKAERLTNKLERLGRKQKNEDLKKLIKERKQDLAMRRRQERKERIARLQTRGANAKVKLKVLANKNSKYLPNYRNFFKRRKKDATV